MNVSVVRKKSLSFILFMLFFLDEKLIFCSLFVFTLFCFCSTQCGV